MSTDQNGFTLIETLVVVLIVAILASIALGLYVDQRTKAQDAEAKAAVTVAAQALTIWHQERDTYGGAGRADLARIEPSLATARDLQVDGDGNGYEVSVESASPSGGTRFWIEYDAGRAVRGCDGRGRGGCRDDGSW